MSEWDYMLTGFVIAMVIGVAVLADGVLGGALGDYLVRLVSRLNPKH